eukprot:scaffold6874_cov74-Skeletonema_dohrnii-CCMP3373.AAC.1
MPRKTNPPAGWTEEQETFIEQCAEEGSPWTESPLIVTEDHRRYAKSRLFVHKRRSLSPKPSTSSNMSTKPSTSSNMSTKDPKIAEIAQQMQAMFVSIPKHNVYQLSVGAGNSRDFIVGLAEALKLPDGKTISAAVVLNPLYSIFFHLDTTAKLVEALTAKKSSEDPGGKPTHAIHLTLPTLLNLLKGKHGMDSSNKEETNLDKITNDMKTSAGFKSSETADGMTICCGKMFNDLKTHGDKKAELFILPTPAQLGATHGNVYDKNKALSYSTAHFNNKDGTLKAIPIKIKNEKGTVDELKLVYGYIIPIEGTESIITVDTPTANNDAAFETFFAGTHHDADRRPTHSPIDSGDLSAATTLQSDAEGTLAEVVLQLKALQEEKNALKHLENVLVETQRDKERNVALQLKNAEEREQQAEALLLV